MPADVGLAFKATHGVKSDKTRLTLALTCNADGSEKKPLLFIGKSKKPRSFKGHMAKYYNYEYAHNSTAWMTAEIFQRWIKSWNSKLKEEDRNILLLLDNFRGHTLPNGGLSNIRVKFFSPNPTSHVHPLDAGIIKCFKSYYQKKAILQSINLFTKEMDKAEKTPMKSMFKVDQLLTMRMSQKAWDSVSAPTLANCWGVTKIIKNSPNSCLEVINKSIENGTTALESQLNTLESIGAVLPQNRMSLSKLLDLEGENNHTLQMCSDEEIFASVQDDDNEEDLGDCNPESKEPGIPRPSKKEMCKKIDEPLEVEPEANKQPLKKKKGLNPRKIAEEKTTPLKKSTTSTAPPSKKKSSTNVALTPRNEATDLVPPSQKSSPSNKAPPADLTDQKGSRSKNYDDEEDVKICHSWLEVSQDPLNSTNQAGDTFWKRAGEQYESTRDDDALYRTWSSVKSRWQILQHAVNKFCGAVQHVKLANKSGKTIQDHITKALAYYKATSEKVKKFTHMQCYYVLYKAPKWLEHCAEQEKKEKEASKKKKKVDDNGTIKSVDLDSIKDDRASDASPVKSNAGGRPPGNRKAKDLVAKAREDKQFKDDITSVHRDLAQQTKTQNDILAAQREALTTLADHDVMSTNLVTVSEASRPFFEWSQKKVLDKVKKERAEFNKKKKAEEQEEAKKKACENKKGDEDEDEDEDDEEEIDT
ncbi:hypothetical protein MJO29_014707 [Puccinia striiformis f. sp. tritici]|nr:hypothetical protein MJO29_014707 [Puccinia striiformis f. sp. tritici]